MNLEIITPRDVPLGGPRAMNVRRTLPTKQRTLIGAWCFADHYGPDDVSASGGMDVPPHPHTGLQTVSWLFTGEIEHRDSIGSHALVHPGELNLMTAGRGISHSEVSTDITRILHGMLLWVALPGSARFTAPAFQHYVPDAVTTGGAELRVFLGSLAGRTSPVSTFTPLLGAEIVLPAGSAVQLDVDEAFEHGIIVDQGSVNVETLPPADDADPEDAESGTLARAELGYLQPGNRAITLRNSGTDDARMLLLGGPPFGEEVVMWWNFMGRTHDDIVAYREAWEGAEHAERDGQFGTVDGYRIPGFRLPAPELPNARIAPRH
ncbi:MAG: pirin family protein [Rhodococcus fascians]